MEINQNIINRAIAKAIVNDTGDLIKLVNRYDATNNNVTYADLLNKIQYLLANNKDFGNNFSLFLIKKQRLADYNNAIGGSIVSGVSSIFTSIVSASSAKKDRVVEQQKIASQNTAQIMNFMANEENQRLAQKQSENNIIYISIGAMVVITGILIFKRK
jgi:hypothetical protein